MVGLRLFRFQFSLLIPNVIAANDKVNLLQAEIDNANAEIEVENQRRLLLERDIASHIERAKLIGDLTNNAEAEMRLHKMAAAVWQGKIKFIRDETKVRRITSAPSWACLEDAVFSLR